MNWLVFSYSLPTKSSSSIRVALWRRLRRLGAVSPASGVQILPERDFCLEELQWLVREIQQAKGEALLMRVQRFEGRSDQQLVALFQETRRADYAKLDRGIDRLQRQPAAKGKRAERVAELRKLRRRHAQIARIDYFECPEGLATAGRLTRLEHALLESPAQAANVVQRALTAYRGKTWVTRPRPHVDRLACVWFIRKFIDPKAVVRYRKTPKASEIAFDMEAGPFTHQGNRCTFETMLGAFGMDEAALTHIAQLVHEIDLRDGRYTLPEIDGIDALLKGWLRMGLSDDALEAAGVGLFEALYQDFSQRRLG